MQASWVVWGSELSPFTLKVLRLYRQAGYTPRFLPAEGGFAEVARFALRRERLVEAVDKLARPR